MSSDRQRNVRRWPRFTLRALLLAITACVIVMAWLTVSARQAQRQREAALRFMELGATLGYSQGDRGNVTLIAFSDYTDLSDEDLMRLDALPHLQTLWLNVSQVTDQGLSHLAAASRLREVHVNVRQITDLGIENLKRLPALEKIVVWGAGFKNESQMVKLKEALPHVTVK